MLAAERLRVAARKQDRDLRVAFADRFGQSKTVEIAGQHHVGEHHVHGFSGRQKIECGFCVIDSHGVVVELLQQRGGHRLHIRIVLDNKDGLAFAIRLGGRFGNDSRDGGMAARQIKRDPRSPADLAADSDSSTRLLHESVRLRESKARPLVGTFRREKRFKDLRQYFGRDASPGIVGRQRRKFPLERIGGFGAAQRHVFRRHCN